MCPLPRIKSIIFLSCSLLEKMQGQGFKLLMCCVTEIQEGFSSKEESQGPWKGQIWPQNIPDPHSLTSSCPCLYYPALDSDGLSTEILS